MNSRATRSRPAGCTAARARRPRKRSQYDGPPRSLSFAASHGGRCLSRGGQAGGNMSALPIATNLYFDNHFGRRGVKLLPNEFYTTREDMVLVTVLGSCV